MFDAKLRPLIDPPLNAAGRWIARRGVSANTVSFAGLCVGLSAASAIAFQAFGLAFALVAIGRVLDGLDGAVARATQKTPFGGYLDIVGDFVFYIAVPVGFAFADPVNMLPALALTASFALTGVSFLAFASIAAEQNQQTTAHGEKSFFYSTGLAEGAETIFAFLLMCLFPQYFPAIAWAYTVLCLLTVAQRSRLAYRQFQSNGDRA